MLIEPTPMRFQWRPPIPGGRDTELIWGSVLAASGLIAAFWLKLGLPTPLCPLHALSGMPCPTCGATRAVGALLHGEIGRAIILNPLMTVLLVSAALYLCYAAVVVIGGFPRLRWEPLTKNEANLARLATMVLLTTNWIYLLSVSLKS
jgi:hypothetical protein